MEEILDAAAAVFASAGYEAATTSAIASTAGISPGSLYQFFADKDAIADALAARYMARMRDVRESAFVPDLAKAPLDRMIGRLVDPFVEFNIANPGFQALFTDPAAAARVGGAMQQLHESVVEQFDGLIGARAPSLSSQDRRRCARVSVQMFRALLPDILASAVPERSHLVRELKRALLAYLTAVLGEAG
jgi:AcrR family transcriptional regulator